MVESLLFFAVAVPCCKAPAMLNHRDNYDFDEGVDWVLERAQKRRTFLSRCATCCQPIRPLERSWLCMAQLLC